MEGKETVTADMGLTNGSRVLLVPKREPIDRPGIIPESEMKRLHQQSQVIFIHSLLSFTYLIRVEFGSVLF